MGRERGEKTKVLTAIGWELVVGSGVDDLGDQHDHVFCEFCVDHLVFIEVGGGRNNEL